LSSEFNSKSAACLYIWQLLAPIIRDFLDNVHNTVYKLILCDNIDKLRGGLKLETERKIMPRLFM